MCALIITDLWNSNVRRGVHVYHPCGPQQGWQGTSDEFVAAGDMERVIPNAQQDLPRWMLGVTDVGRGIVLLKCNRTAGPQDGNHLSQYRFLNSCRQVDQHEPFVNHVVRVLFKTGLSCVSVDHLDV